MRRESSAHGCKRSSSEFLQPLKNPRAKVEWKKPKRLQALPDDGSFDITEGWKKLDRSVQPVDSFRGGTSEALKLLRDFVISQARALSRAAWQA